jgi:hypothetical protein
MLQNGRWRLLLVLALVAMAALHVRQQQSHLDVMLDTDEADYVRASRYGPLASYIGSRERSGAVFAVEVIDDYRRTGSSHAYAREWDADDASALRHYHPPFAFYPVAMLTRLHPDERTMRMVPLATGVLASVVSALLAYVLLAGSSVTVRLLFSAAAGVATAASPYHALTSTTIGPHAAFSLLSTLTLVALARAVQTSSARWWIAASASLGATLLTIPYWILLIVAGLWVWIWGLQEGRRSVRLLLLGCATALVVMTLAWPPGVLTLGMAKPVLLYLSIAMNPPDVGRAIGDWIPAFVRAHPLMTGLLLVGIAGLWLAPVRQRRAAVPALIFTIGFVLLNLRVSYMKPLYVGDVIPAAAALGCALAAMALTRLPSRITTSAAVVILVLVSGSAVRTAAVSRPSPDWRRALSELDERLAGQRLLVTPRQAGAMVKYYLPHTRVSLDSDDPGEVRQLREQLAEGNFDVVLAWNGVIDPRGASADVTRGRAASGHTMVDASTISWWLMTDRAASSGSTAVAQSKR